MAGMKKSRRGTGTGAKGPKPLHGLAKKSRSPQTKWQIDYDYVHKLPLEVQEYLDTFTNEHYLNVSRAKAKLLNDEQLVERWRAYMQNRRDIMSRGISPGTSETYVEDTDSFDGTDDFSELSEEDAMIARIDGKKAQTAWEAKVAESLRELEDEDPN
jgi:hypothetical protein